MGSTIFLEQDLFKGCRIIFDKTEYTVSADFYNNFESFLNDNAKVIKSLNDKVENQRKELSSLLAKNKKLEEENQKLRDINNKNFWPNGKAPVVDFPVLQYDSIPSWFDFTFTNFRYDSRRTLNLPGKITIEGVSDDHKKIDAFVEHGDMFSGIFSICRMSDIKDLVDKYNALVVDNRHLELEKASALNSLALVETNLKGVRKKVEVAEGEYEKMKEVLKRWHDATGCDNFNQAKKKIENMAKEIQEWKDATCRYSPEQAKARYDGLKASNTQLEALIYGVEGCYKPIDIGGENQKPLCYYLANRGYSGAVDAINKLEKEIREFRDDKEGRRTLIQYKSDRINKLHNMIWGGPGYHPLIVGGELRTAKGYLEHKGYKCFVDAITSLEADIALLKDREIQCAEGTYSVFIHPDHMNALQIDVKHDRYQAETRLIEECSELIQALAKRKRAYSPEVNYIGSHELMELAHVVISAIVYCRYWGISNELLQKAVQVKYPEPYED